jgi:hypothetical protein
MASFSFLPACTYTAPFRQLAAAPEGANTIVVTLSAVENRPGQRRAFFADTKRVLADLPNQSGLLGYSYRFEILGRRAWTMTAWQDEASRDRFPASPVHRAAVKNSPVTAQNMRFISVKVPASAPPMKWTEALRLLDGAPAYD